MLTQERLKQIFHYDPETGLFVRLLDRGGQKAGEIAGSVNGKGYVHMMVDRKIYSAHRLAWLYVHGEFPKNGIDHIDAVKTNNRIANLRDATATVNNQNRRKAQKNSATGYLGVTAKCNGFQSRISQKNLGIYATPEQAYEVAIAARRENFEGFTI